METVISEIQKSLAGTRFRIRLGSEVGLDDVAFVASRTIFIATGLLLMSTHFLVAEKDNVDPKYIDKIFGEGFKVARRINKLPLLRGMQFGYAICPTIISHNPEPNSLLYASTVPEQRWALVEYPIIVDRTRNQVAYFKGNAKLGAQIWPSLTNLIEKHLLPVD